MSEINLIRSTINHEIEKLEEDKIKINIELDKAHEQIFSNDNKEYKSNISNLIEHNKLDALRGSIILIENEIKLFNDAFTDDMINDLDYILLHNKTPAPKANASRIVHARVDIARFENSNLSITDYQRDTKNIQKKYKEIAPFLTAIPQCKIPEKPHSILKELIFFINHTDAEHFGYEEIAKKMRFSDSATKDIISTISILKRMPKGLQEFSDKLSNEIYLTDIKD